jgi:hypothetical protein
MSALSFASQSGIAAVRAYLRFGIGSLRRFQLGTTNGAYCVADRRHPVDTSTAAGKAMFQMLGVFLESLSIGQVGAL